MTTGRLIPFEPLTRLDGQRITRWIGLEMALGGGDCVVTDDTVSNDGSGRSPIVWAYASVPFWQFTMIDVETSAGVIYRLRAEFDHEDESAYGLFLAKTDEPMAWIAEEPGAFFRTRVLEELPTGIVKVGVEQDTGGAIVEALLDIGGDVVRLLAAEIHPRLDGGFDLVSPDETILLQLNGKRPMSDEAERRAAPHDQ
ncbi:hypothetical protein CDL60_19255 [Roseateles noduli]|nr:hypothetical protein CDL60_19255 [Roseateles noduli]